MSPIDVAIDSFGEIGKLSTIWEYQFRLLCHNLNLEPYRIIKTEYGEKLHAKKLNKVMDSFYLAFPYIEFDFSFAHRIRNSVAHANFLEFTDILSEDVEDNLLGRVLTLSLSSGEILDLKKPIPDGKLSEVGIFGLFLRSINQKTLEESSIIMKVAIEAVSSLQNLRSLSDKNDYFNKLFVRGERFTDEDFKNFDEEWKLSSVVHESGSNFLPKYYHYSKLDI